MLYKLKKLTACFLLSTIACTSFANDDLPEIGTAGAGGLSIAKEKQYGWAFKMLAQQSLPIVRDPVLNNYLTSLGENIVSHADSVKLPFEFFLVEDNEINAAAFLGGNIKINTGLFLYAETESELASVIAHEVAHITQRHLARMLEKQSLNSPASIAALAGSVLLTIIAPAAGFAALTSTFAINIQNQINYTRSNEYEADRIGIQTLAKAGYNPYGMADFFGRLANKYKYASSQPQMLLTHPLPETRLAEARLRASQLINKHLKKSLDYQLSKARIIVRFNTDNVASLINRYKSELSSKSYQVKAAAQYGLALAFFKNKQLDLAEKLNNQLLDDDPDNLFYIDLATDISLSTNKNEQAITRLTDYEKRYTSNAVSTLNLVIALKEDKQYALADKKLSYFIRNHPDHVLAHQVATDLYKEMKDKAKEFASKAEYLALLGRFKEASEQMGSALAYTDKKLDQARYSAKIEEYKRSDLRLKELQE